MIQLLFLLCTSLFVLPNLASASSERVSSANQAVLSTEISIPSGNKFNRCSPSLQNCTIQITKQTGCVQQSGFITITNNSKSTAKNINASSTNSNYLTYVIPNNGCPASLLPGASCTMTFYTNSSVAFTANNIVVKGTNTNATYFNLQAVQCTPFSATLSVSPLNLSFVAGLTSQAVTVTNNSNSPVPAMNVHASPVSPLTVQSTNCPSNLAIGLHVKLPSLRIT